jgi:hypothetical protein
MGEAFACNEPELFSGGSLPSWFGNVNPGWAGLYTVQYLEPCMEDRAAGAHRSKHRRRIRRHICVPIFGNDYPTPLSDRAAVFPTFEL